MTDVVDQELEKLIARRASADHRTTADEREELWKASVRAHHAAREDERRAAWREYHRDQAARLRRNLEALIAEHETQAARLCKEGA